MDAERAGKMYLEQNSHTAISSTARYQWVGARDVLWLDLATNTGVGLETCVRKPNVVTDISFDFLRIQKGDRVACNALQLPFQDRYFGLITAFELIEHMSTDDARKLICRSLRLLDPQGCLVVSTPNAGAYGKRMSSPDHVVEYTLDGLLDLCDQCGAKVVGIFGQGRVDNRPSVATIISIRDNPILSNIYYNIPAFLRNLLRVAIQRNIETDKIYQLNDGNVPRGNIVVLRR